MEIPKELKLSKTLSTDWHSRAVALSSFICTNFLSTELQG
ncbi:hypothetical protein LEP1GSC049_1535 [Leptospira kirschneri serovar Cynopteri str. 3522 CT]|nr:hypothetical protein LEP1GSC044_0754 [Leptospira kirschneri serovar Grippotyphosa str. RM52]EKP05393.1 hypothetical protein LEP1GSC018_1430 [Leptospira kirschneri str. 2008720114]EKQ83161.1 hypothetical protein LEP1GSC064_1191 [Leptospira kirschneri serovar Grippotyphosa str. Moskva]EKR08014.1 hypothetical protein LEP1GSC122_2225 [Leptospira kirschneri serovar Valbuzzi str. 200702274]EMK00702.1 hypothetical protein LEP1GSC176_0789 [Leptospira kirschneri str. MMD1493]EMK18648.1 hypothetical 